MRRQLVVTPGADAEIIQAAQWYEERQVDLGVRFLLNLDVVFDAVRVRPQSFPIAHKDLRRALVRSFPYAAYFKTTRSSVRVVAVRHTAMQNRDLRINEN